MPHHHEHLVERIGVALDAMQAEPRSLRAYLEQPGPDFPRAAKGDVDKMLDMILDPDPNAPLRLRFSTLLRSWDNNKDARWTGGTSRNTNDRRTRIHNLLKLDAALATRINEVLPFYDLDEPIIISDQHEDWYSPAAGVRDYYWQAYVKYLRERKQWDERSLINLENHTRAVVECLANPQSPSAYASRGLVMGYVQSGKTANFIGVTARAADAGFRLVIVLAGTWNILRNQTQRRFDKELLGKELLANDESYQGHLPPDWSEFLEHGANPADLGHYGWQRLTRPDIDFKRLKSAIDSLEFEKRERTAPLYDARNLFALPAKLLVVKKNAGILENLAHDLRLLSSTRLADLPTIVIDDESDQAGVNTANPFKAAAGRKSRSPLNEAIVDLLKLFPRAQYVGYTATPYANALVDPDDPDDLFPKDFILPLDRPSGYMGVADFFDPETDYEDLAKDDFRQKEIAFIRRVSSPVGTDDDDIRAALRCYVLAGALKLYRKEKGGPTCKGEYFKHHTMLLHTSPRKGEMASNAARVEVLWDSCAFNSPAGLSELKKLWESDYCKVSQAQSDLPMPASFNQLVPFLGEAIKQIESGPAICIVVNSDSLAAPDFSAAPVWKIIIGGNKLSRGYTVEGLTVSYYRRVAGAADTLMQMGRWFGFRPGYGDLVRVFLGVNEGKRGGQDLVSLFKEVCRIEEKFRDDIARYVRKGDGTRLTPRDVPPLISLAGNLPPTSVNKMFNAQIESKNFGGTRSMPTLLPTKPTTIRRNLALAGELLKAAEYLGLLSLGGSGSGKERYAADAHAFLSQNTAVHDFLSAMKWLESEFKDDQRPPEINLQLEFLATKKHEIADWLIVAPQRRKSFGTAWVAADDLELTVKERTRGEGRGIGVVGEPQHRSIGEFIARIGLGNKTLTSPNDRTRLLQNEHRAVMLLYPFREIEDGPISIGFELIFPTNDLGYDLNLTVKRATGAATVNAS
jgi:hypothetical protein